MKLRGDTYSSLYIAHVLPGLWTLLLLCQSWRRRCLSHMAWFISLFLFCLHEPEMSNVFDLGHHPIAGKQRWQYEVKEHNGLLLSRRIGVDRHHFKFQGKRCQILRSGLRERLTMQDIKVLLLLSCVLMLCPAIMCTQSALYWDRIAGATGHFTVCFFTSCGQFIYTAPEFNFAKSFSICSAAHLYVFCW